MSLIRAFSRHPILVIAAALALTLGATVLSARLKLRTAFSELLPHDDPGVVALRKTQARLGDLSLLLVGISSPDAAANERYAEALTNKLRSLPPSVSDIATFHVRDIYKFVEDNRWLYAGEGDLEAIRDRLKREILLKKNPLAISFDDGEDDKALEQRMKGSAPLQNRFPGGVFRNAKTSTIWVAALPPGGLMVENAGEALLAATTQFIRDNPPANFHPRMDVLPTGPVVTPLRNRAALAADLTMVAALCMILIPLSIGLYFRRIRAVFFVTVPAVVATVMAYGAAYLMFGYLTTVTSFLVSFVLGNGTNYAIVLLARYEEHRRQGASAAAAAVLACEELWRPTGVAAIASALSYGSLLVTSFRGFSQFGLIGGVGCLFAWCATFTIMPALLSLFDRRGPAPIRLGRQLNLLPRLAHLIGNSPRGVMAVGVAISAVMVLGASHFGRDAFEYDFRKLSAKGTTEDRVRAFDDQSDELFGRWPAPTVLLADRAEDVAAMRAAIRKADSDLEGPDVIGDIYTIDDLLPGSPAVQQRKLALLEGIRRALDDPAMALATDDEKRDLERLRPPASLHVVSAADLPPLARRPFTEANGTLGRVLLVYPPLKGLSVWDGHALLKMASVLQRIELPDGSHVETSGHAVIFAAMIRSVLHDGPLASLASLTAVVLLVLLRVRPLKAALFVIGALLAGVLWMAGIAGWLGVKVTFLNFIVVPFIFGVGVEYAIHVVSEFKEHGSLRRTIISTGGPVALCSWSAIVGYGSLLAARNGALNGLGGVATLGEITCLVAAVVLLPAALLLSRVPVEEQHELAAHADGE